MGAPGVKLPRCLPRLSTTVAIGGTGPELLSALGCRPTQPIQHWEPMGTTAQDLPSGSHLLWHHLLDLWLHISIHSFS